MKVTLISWTQDPINTVLKVWDASKGETSTADIEAKYSGEPSPESHALFQRVIDQQIPVSQNVVFNFILDDVPVAWREQAVRHRVGVKYGDNYAVDIIPEADFSFWSQSMRIQSMGHFSEDSAYFTPESVAGDGAAESIYRSTMQEIEDGYNALVQLGIPMEDARNVIPLGATHRISMTINLQSLQHIIGERGCWILQASLWHPIIEGIVEELATKVDPVFRRLVAPPCVSAGAYKGCTFTEENRRRVRGDDKLPTCPLYAQETNARLAPSQISDTARMIPKFARLWGQDELLETWEWSKR